MDKRIFLALGLLMAFHWSFGQKIVPNGRFAKDSVKIGEAIDYVLTVKYPLDWEVIYPDSSFNFAPFEFYRKSFSPTRADSIYAIDSVVYSLATFEIDVIQKLALPIFVLHQGDSLEVLPLPDSVVLQEMIINVPDTVRLKSNFRYLPVKYALNYPYYAIGGLIFIVLCVVIFVLFGKNIRAKIKLYRMKKSFQKFSADFENGINNIRNNEHNAQLIEDILVIWKKYMESLENKPFTKYTSKEVVKAGYEKTLGEVLQNIDRAIYGKMNSDQMHKNFEALEDFTLEQYNAKRKKIQEGNDQELEEKSTIVKQAIVDKQIAKLNIKQSTVREDLKNGGRFVVYFYTISILVMTFRRSSKVYFIQGDESGIKQGLVFSLISFLFGWWGFPFGLIYTPQSLYVNFKGGKNITQEVLRKALN